MIHCSCSGFSVSAQVGSSPLCLQLCLAVISVLSLSDIQNKYAEINTPSQSFMNSFSLNSSMPDAHGWKIFVKGFFKNIF